MSTILSILLSARDAGDFSDAAGEREMAPKCGSLPREVVFVWDMKHTDLPSLPQDAGDLVGLCVFHISNKNYRILNYSGQHNTAATVCNYQITNIKAVHNTYTGLLLLCNTLGRQWRHCRWHGTSVQKSSLSPSCGPSACQSELPVLQHSTNNIRYRKHWREFIPPASPVLSVHTTRCVTGKAAVFCKKYCANNIQKFTFAGQDIWDNKIHPKSNRFCYAMLQM